MKQLAWAIFQLFTGYVIVLAFDGVVIGVWPFIATVVGGAFIASLAVAAFIAAFKSLVRPLLNPPARRIVRRRREPVLTEWLI